MADAPGSRKQSWMRAQSDGFRPIKSVGVAVAFGLPLTGMGVFVLFAALLGTSSTFLWVLAAGLIVVGLVAAASGRTISRLTLGTLVFWGANPCAPICG